MFTGIINGTATLEAIEDHDAIRTFIIEFPEGFCDDLAVGASVSVDGVCLTVTKILTPIRASFDVILQTLRVTTLSDAALDQRVNVERAARNDAEIGGHPISGHVDFSTPISDLMLFEGNKVLRIDIPQAFSQYIFPKGFIALNGASLTVAEVNKQEGWFEVWLIPETRRVTAFELKNAGDRLNVEIERQTQILVDTTKSSVKEILGNLLPFIESLLLEKGMKVEDFVDGPRQLTKSADSADS